MSENPFGILTDEPVPDSRLHVRDVITTGRARVRRRHRRTALAGACAAVVLIGAVAGIAFAGRPQHREPAHPDPVPSVSTAPPPGCTARRVDVGRDIGGALTDPTGTWIAFSRAPDPSRLVIIHGGSPAVEVQPPAVNYRVAGVNAAGTTIGTGRSNERSTAFRTTADGTTTALRSPSGAVEVRATGINAAGDIVGEATMPNHRFRAVIWRHTAPDTPVLLLTPTGKSSSAYAVTDDGRVAGTMDNGAAAFIWNPDNSGAALPTPVGMPGGIATDITGDWAAGFVNYLAITTVDPDTGHRVGKAGGGQAVRVRWHLPTGTVEIVRVDEVALGLGGVTRDGAVAVNQSAGAVLWHDGAATEVPEPEGYDHPQIDSMSADGTVLLGTAVPATGGSIEPFRWDCRR